MGRVPSKCVGHAHVLLFRTYNILYGATCESAEDSNLRKKSDMLRVYVGFDSKSEVREVCGHVKCEMWLFEV